MELKLDATLIQNQLSELVKAEVLKLFTPERRDQLLQEAVDHILNGKTNYSGKSPLYDAFDRAITSALHEIVREELSKNEPLQAKLRGLTAMAITKTFFTEEREKHLVDKLAGTFAEFIQRDSRW